MIGRQPNSAVRSDGQSVGGSYIFDQGFVGVAVSQFNSLYRHPRHRGDRDQHAHRPAPDQGDQQGRIPSRLGSPIEAIRFWVGVSDYKHDELANEGGFDGVQQTFTNKAQEGRVEVQLTPFDLRFAALTTALGVQASRQELTAPGAGAAACSIRTETTSVAGFMFNEFRFTDTLRMQLAGRIEHVHGERLVAGFPGRLRSRPAASSSASTRSRDFTPKSAADRPPARICRSASSAASRRSTSSARRARPSCSRAASTRRPARSRSAIRTSPSNPPARSRSACGARRGPFRFEATAYPHPLLGLHLQAPHRRARAARTSPPAASRTSSNQVVYSQRDATFRGGEIQAQLDVAAARGRHLRRRRPIRHRARDLHRRHQRAAHPAAARSAAACSGATPTGSRASACCTRSRRTTSPTTRRRPTATICSRPR